MKWFLLSFAILSNGNIDTAKQVVEPKEFDTFSACFAEDFRQYKELGDQPSKTKRFCSIDKNFTKTKLTSGFVATIVFEPGLPVDFWQRFLQQSDCELAARDMVSELRTLGVVAVNKEVNTLCREE